MSIQYHFKANADRIFDLLTDADFLVERCLALGELSADCTVEEQDAYAVIITLTRELERELPAFLSQLFDSRQTLEIIERWNTHAGTRHGKYTMKVVGQPIIVDALMTLKPERKDACVYDVRHSARANFPLIGGRIEKFILGQTEGVTRAELDYLADALKK